MWLRAFYADECYANSETPTRILSICCRPNEGVCTEPLDNFNEVAFVGRQTATPIPLVLSE